MSDFSEDFNYSALADLMQGQGESYSYTPRGNAGGTTGPFTGLFDFEGAMQDEDAEGEQTRAHCTATIDKQNVPLVNRGDEIRVGGLIWIVNEVDTHAHFLNAWVLDLERVNWDVAVSGDLREGNS